MKKIIVFVLIFACILGLPGCAGKSDDIDLVSLIEISELVADNGYAEEDFQEKLLGEDRDNLIDAWGEPDGMLSGFWGDIWHLSGESNQQIILYYDENGAVENIRIVER